MFLEKNRIKHSRLRLFVLVVVTITLALLASVFVYASQTREVVIDYKGHKMVVKTMGITVKDVLDENQLKLEAGDIVKPELNQAIGPSGIIEIKNAQSAQSKIQQLIEQSKLVQVKNEIAKSIKEVKQDHEEKIVVEKSKLEFETEKRANSRLEAGRTKIVRQGKNGVVEKTFQVSYRDGKEVSRKLLSKKVIEKPVNQLVEYGTKSTVVTSRGETVRYSRIFTMRATAYTASFADTGKKPGHPDFGITASGLRVKPGIVAVDPRVIPLGTRLYIESLQEGVPDYGMALAADTGGAIKGNKIDLYFNTSNEVDNWGVRKVKVYILQ